MKLTPLPVQPWIKINTDLFGPLDGGYEHILVVQDTYSRYPVTAIVHSTSGAAVIPAMDRILSLFGIPEYIGSDNGPPYNSTSFRVIYQLHRIHTWTKNSLGTMHQWYGREFHAQSKKVTTNIHPRTPKLETGTTSLPESLLCYPTHTDRTKSS